MTEQITVPRETWDALQAKLDELQRQAPVGVVDSALSGGIGWTTAGEDLEDGQELYAAPKALEPLTELCMLLSSAWHHGGWKAETYNERRMQQILECLGYWPYTEAPSHGITKGTP